MVDVPCLEDLWTGQDIPSLATTYTGEEASLGRAGQGRGGPPTSQPSGASVQAPQKRLSRGRRDQSRAGFLKSLHLIRGAQDVSRREIWKQLLQELSFE
jgi:hypothetical protein